MSPIYKFKKNKLSEDIKDKGLTLSVILSIILLALPFVLISSDSSPGIFLLWLLAPFIGFGNIIGRVQRSAFLTKYKNEYLNIQSEYKKIAKKKELVGKKDVDKITKSLSTNNFSYTDVLDIMIYYEDIDNHKKQLNKKINKTFLDTRVNIKSGEKLLFRTHAAWHQGSAEQNIFKDNGFFFMTNKRIIFLGDLRSYSTNFTRVAHCVHGPDYFLVQKTAGINDIYIIEPEESIDCLAKIYNTRTK